MTARGPLRRRTATPAQPDRRPLSGRRRAESGSATDRDATGALGRSRRGRRTGRPRVPSAESGKARDMGRGVGIASGTVAAGLLGAAARPTVVYVFWLRGADGDLSGVLFAISAGIGLVVGVVA